MGPARFRCANFMTTMTTFYILIKRNIATKY